MYCSICGKDHEPQREIRTTVINLKGIDYIVPRETFVCGSREFVSEKQDRDAVVYAHDMHKNGLTPPLLTSVEIEEICDKYLLSPEKLGVLLGWSPTTIKRYFVSEQSRAYDLMLRKIRDNPAWVLELMEENDELYAQKNRYTKIKSHVRMLAEQYEQDERKI